MSEGAQTGISANVGNGTMNEALRAVMTAPWVDVATMATVLDVGLAAAYKEARAGRFGAFRIGSLYRVPTPELRKALGLPMALSPALPIEQAAA